jgi:hypothetical protein
LNLSSELKFFTCCFISFKEFHSEVYILEHNRLCSHILYFYLHTIFSISKCTNSVQICCRKMYDVQRLSVSIDTDNFYVSIIWSYIDWYFHNSCFTRLKHICLL